MFSRDTQRTFNKLKSKLIDLYIGNKTDAEILIDITFRRCIKADRDHHRDPRIYMHVGCEDMIICVSSSIELLGQKNLQGLFLHEIGHTIHMELPDLLENVLDDEELVMIENMDDDEIVADYIIDRLFGIHIYYDDKKVQWAVI